MGPWIWALDVNSRTTHRVSFDLEKYVSIAASADGGHLVATESNPIPSLWIVPILNHVARAGCKAVSCGDGASIGPALWRYIPVSFVLSRHGRWAVALPGWPDHGDLERFRWRATRAASRFPRRPARRHRAPPFWEIDAAHSHLRRQRNAADRRVDRHQWGSGLVAGWAMDCRRRYRGPYSGDFQDSGQRRGARSAHPRAGIEPRVVAGGKPDRLRWRKRRLLLPTLGHSSGWNSGKATRH